MSNSLHKIYIFIPFKIEFKIGILFYLKRTALNINYYNFKEEKILFFLIVTIYEQKT